MRYKEPIRDPKIREDMQATFNLYEFALDLMRQNLRRRHPEASPEEIQQRLCEWEARRPGAELGDAAGRPSTRFGLIPT